MSVENVTAQRKRPSLPVVILLIATCVVGVGGIVLVARFVHEAINGGPKHIAYMQAIDDAKRAGVPVTPQLLQAPLPPAEQNAGPIYTQLTDLLDALPLSKADAIINSMSSKEMPSSGQFEQIRRALKHRSDVVNLIHKAAARPQSVFVRDWSDPVSVAFNEFKTIRSGSRILASESLLMAHDGQPLDAVRNMALGFKLAKQVENENLLISYLVSVALDAITISGLQKIIYLSNGETVVADAVRKVIETDWRPHSVSRAIHTEAGTHIIALQVLRKQGPSSLNQFVGNGSTAPESMSPGAWNALIDESGSLLLKRERDVNAAADLPYLKSLPIIRAIDSAVDADKDPQHLLVSDLFPDYEAVVRKQAQILVTAGITRAAAAVLSYKGRDGAYPVQLEGALKPDPVPVDPFDGKPLRYRREGNGFVIYSVGADGKFAGGEPGKVKGRFDVLFRYPMPKYYAKAMKEK